MGEPHLLQRLVYVESEEYERRKEAAARTLNPQRHHAGPPVGPGGLLHQAPGTHHHQTQFVLRNAGLESAAL